MDTRLWWLALGGFAGAFESFLLGSLLPSISTDMGVTIGVAGLVVTGYALVHGLGTPVLAAIFGAADRRKILTTAEFTFAIAALLIALSPEFPWLFVARIVLAVGAGLYTVTALATAVGMSTPERRGQAIGTVVAGQSAAVLVGVPVGALLAANFGWRAVYIVIALLGLAAASALFVRLPRGLTGDRKTLLERIQVARVPGIPLALLTTLLFMIAAYLPIIYIAPYTLHAARIGRDLLPIVLLANGIGAVAGSNLGGRIADRLGTRQATLLATAAQVAIMVCYVTVPSLPGPLALIGLLLTMGAHGFIGWGFWPAQSSRIAGLAPDSVPLALSLNGTALNLGVALCATIGGATIDNIGAGAIALVGLPFAIASLVVATVSREPPPAVTAAARIS